MNSCRTEDLKSALNTNDVKENSSELKHITNSFGSATITMKRTTFKKNNEFSEKYPVLEKRIVYKMWDKFGGVASAPDLNIYLGDIPSNVIYRVLERLESRGIVRTINNDYPELRNYTNWNHKVYALNI